MRMLKGESGALNFDQLMAQATQVAKQQDASLMERARQKRREDDERRRREEKERRESENAQALLEKKRELQEKKQKLLMDQNKKLGVKSRTQLDKTKVRTGSNTKVSTQRKANSVASFLPEKKKPVHMSFDELMKKAKEQSLAKGGKTEPKQPLPPKKYGAHDTKSHSNDNTPTLYHRLKRPEIARPTSSSSITGDGLSARERGKLLIAEPPKKLNLQKRDRRTIADVQREIRHSKGIHSDDEDDRPTRTDPRLMNKARPLHGKTNSPPRKRMLSPPRPTKRVPSQSERKPNPPVRRMPFSGRPLDPSARRSLPPQRRRYRDEEEEEDEELASFIVDDEDEYDDPGYSRAPRRNSYSEEISKIFKYDKSRYANDPVYSDDDMEANARDVLLEEKRSERLAKREDYLEEQRELERLKKRKKNNSR